MAKVPLKFKRVAAAFNEAARVRLCESSGSEHYSPHNSTDLSDLVNSFLEREYRNQGADREDNTHQESNDQSILLQESATTYWSDTETKDTLKNLLNNTTEDDDGDAVRQKILSETQRACDITGERSSQGFKRRLMSRLRDAGFDASLYS